MVNRTCITFFLIAMLVGGPAEVPGQSKTQTRRVVQKPPKEISLILMGGAGIPMSGDSLTDIWRYGPNFSLEFLSSVNRRLAVGAGVDLSVLRWSYAGYYDKYPSGPPPLDRKVIWWDLYMLGRYTFLLNSNITPYVTVKLGATRPTPALFREVVDSVRVTYYSVAGRTRLSFGASGGVDIRISYELAFVAEVNAVFVHHDPVLGAALSIRGGFRMTW